MINNSINVIFEGLDKTGKSTQIDLIYNFLNENFKNIKIIKTKEPGNTEVGKYIREILLNKDISMSNFTEYFLFLADRYEHIEYIKNITIKNNTKKNNNFLFLFDRSHFSTFAYQIYPHILNISSIKNKYDKKRLKEFIKIDKLIGKNIFKIIKPDLIFYFHKNKDNDVFLNKDRIEKREKEYFDKVKEGFQISFYYYFNFNNILNKIPFENGIESNFDYIKKTVINLINKKFKGI
jgi:dTMP kinase